jgi:hypothetical protein
MPQNVEASKWEEQKQTWQLASRWEVTTYHTSTRLQLITLAHLSNRGPAGEGTLPSDLSPGFIIPSSYPS